ncbi:MAG: rhomboid family intramembrane serine protease [Pirellulaceae bacterium]|nr:rhomboid family intramembrane serine protease [Pirellulaceae bacterium]
MLIPYQTDAPLYHWPIATVGTIVVNVLVFFFVLTRSEEAAVAIYEACMLLYGYWLPWQWFTSNYLHGDIMHLIGNMIFLWSFGMIVEGKVGWWRFLLIYNGIGIAECALEQTLMLGFDEGGSLGASAAIFGLIAIAMIWAPANEISCLFFIGFRSFSFDCSIWIFSGVSLAIELGMGIIHVSMADDAAAAITSQALHLAGAGVGFAVGIAMLKLGWVDCENWDAFSVWSGRNEKKKHELAQEYIESPQGQAVIANKRDTMLNIIRHHLAAGDAASALVVHRRGIAQMPAWRLPEEDHVALITGLRSRQLYDDAILVMAEYLKLHNQREPLIRLALGQVLLTKLKRPAQAARVLAKIVPDGLDPAQQQQAASLLAKAQALAEEDPYEVAGEDW